MKMGYISFLIVSAFIILSSLTFADDNVACQKAFSQNGLHNPNPLLRKPETVLPALIWNPLHFPSGDSLNQTLLRAGYQSIQTDSLSLYIDSLSNYHLLVMGGVYEQGDIWTLVPSDIEPEISGILDFLRNGGSLYWEGAATLGGIDGHFGDQFLYYFHGGGMGWNIPLPYLTADTNSYYSNPLFNNIDSLGYRSDGARFSWLEGDSWIIKHALIIGSSNYSMAITAAVDQAHTMLTNFSFSRVEDTSVNTRIDLINDIMAWLSGEVSIDEPKPHIPSSFSLSQNYPNPFNPDTRIDYALPEASHVTLEIYDMLGRRVASLIDEEQEPGYHQAVWNAKDCPSGMYFYRLKAGSFTETKKMILMK